MQKERKKLYLRAKKPKPYHFFVAKMSIKRVKSLNSQEINKKKNLRQMSILKI